VIYHLQYQFVTRDLPSRKDWGSGERSPGKDGRRVGKKHRFREQKRKKTSVDSALDEEKGRRRKRGAEEILEGRRLSSQWERKKLTGILRGAS